MSVSKVPKTVIDLVKPAVDTCAMRIYMLTHGRKGKERAKPTILTFYETGIVFAVYEQLLMSPALADWDIRWEEKEVHGKSTKWIDLWLRPVNGGKPIRIEAGDLPIGGIGKANSDAKKLITLHAAKKSASSWFLAFVRDLHDEVERNKIKKSKLAGAAAAAVYTTPEEVLVWRIKKSLNRKGGLDKKLLQFDERLVRVCEIYRPGGASDTFAAILFKIRV